MELIFPRGVEKELNSFELYVCINQGYLFEECQYHFYGALDPFDFVERFMVSDIASDMDNDLCYAHTWGLVQMMDVLVEELDLKPFTGKYLDYRALHWIGYMYRYWVFWLGISSKEVYAQVPLEKALESYLGLHTLDPKEAIYMWSRW